jgi:SAM-dependent methyltransferase
VTPRDVEDLIAEAAAAPVDGWGFSWLDGRAREERPPWGYTRLLVPRVEHAHALLDVQTGGGEVLAEVLGRAGARPRTIAATEGWPPNAAIARTNLRPFGGTVHDVGPSDRLPFADGTFDLVVERHPVTTGWDEIARVLERDGHYVAQHVGAGANRELTEFLMGPRPVSDSRSAARAATDAQASGLEVVDLRAATPRVEFDDIGAVVWFLRKVIWTVPGFDVERYRDRLVALDARIRADGPFVSHAPRFLIEARKP